MENDTTTGHASIAPERLARFTTQVGDLHEMTDEEISRILTPSQALAKHTAMMNEEYGDDGRRMHL